MKINIALLMAALSAPAVPLAAIAAPTPVRIQQVDVDQQAGTLTIVGTGFDNKTDTRIDLGAYTALDILSETSTQIVAALPTGLAPGGYLLIATVTNGSSQTDEFDLMIDAFPRPDVVSLQNQVDALAQRLSELEDLLQGVSRFSTLISDDQGQTFDVDTLEFSGMNIQIVNGLGPSDGLAETNGAGNLIVGYNETRGDEGCPDNPNCDRRWGSHMVVVGTENNYTSFGGIVAGGANETAEPLSSVLGGFFNTAVGVYSVIGGGYGNTTRGDYSVVNGGQFNLASGEFSSVSGGKDREAEDAWCVLGDNGDMECSTAAVCGNGVLEQGEICEVNDFGPSCAALGMGALTDPLPCDGTCSGWDTSTCQ